MQQQLNTPEDLRAIRQAMDEGKNPLVETDVPRWEDQVGISRIVNRLHQLRRDFQRLQPDDFRQARYRFTEQVFQVLPDGFSLHAVCL